MAENEQRKSPLNLYLSHPDGCHHAWRNRKIQVVTRRCRKYVDEEYPDGVDICDVVTCFHDRDFAQLFIAKMNPVNIYGDDAESKWIYSVTEVDIESR